MIPQACWPWSTQSGSSSARLSQFRMHRQSTPPFLAPHHQLSADRLVGPQRCPATSKSGIAVLCLLYRWTRAPFSGWCTPLVPLWALLAALCAVASGCRTCGHAFSRHHGLRSVKSGRSTGKRSTGTEVCRLRSSPLAHDYRERCGRFD